eukprot:scaffold277943_cov53-Attheya_sp.AAC.2
MPCRHGHRRLAYSRPHPSECKSHRPSIHWALIIYTGTLSLLRTWFVDARRFCTLAATVTFEVAPATTATFECRCRCNFEFRLAISALVQHPLALTVVGGTGDVVGAISVLMASVLSYQ